MRILLKVRIPHKEFNMFNADVEFHVVMTPDDLKRAGLDALGKKWS